MNNKSYLDFRSAAEASLEKHPRSNLYLLLDKAALPVLATKLLNKSMSWMTLFDGAKEESAIAAAPILVLIALDGQMRATRRFFQWVDENTSDTSSAILISSLLPLDVLKKRLGARLNVELSEGISAMLRFYDPKVLEILAKVLKPTESEVFLGLADSWIYPNRAGEFVTISSKVSDVDEFEPPLQLDQVQESTLVEASEIDQVLDLLRKVIPSKMAELSVRHQYFHTLNMVEKAKSDGIGSVLGYSIYAAIAFVKGTDVTASSGWQNLVAELRGGNFDTSKFHETVEHL